MLKWDATLNVTNHTNQLKSLNPTCSATLGLDLSTSNLRCLYLTWLGFVRLLAPEQPAGVPLTPKSSQGPWPRQHRLSKPSSFQLRRIRGTSLFPPTINIPFSRRDNFIHLVHHCIQLKAGTMQTLDWIELACSHVLKTGKNGRCYVFISSFWQENACKGSLWNKNS